MIINLQAQQAIPTPEAHLITHKTTMNINQLVLLRGVTTYLITSIFTVVNMLVPEAVVHPKKVFHQVFVLCTNAIQLVAITEATIGVIIVTSMLVPRIIAREKRIIAIFLFIALITNVMIRGAKTEKKTMAIIVVNTNAPTDIVHRKNPSYRIIV